MLRAPESFEVLFIKESHLHVSIVGEFPWEEARRTETMQTLASHISLPFRSLPYKNNIDSQKYFENSNPSKETGKSIIIILGGTLADILEIWISSTKL